MKKLIFFKALTLATLFSSVTNAKTAGSSIEADLLLTKASISSSKVNIVNKKSGTFGGAGISYKYAFNYKGMFVEPAIFIDAINAGFKLTRLGVTTSANEEIKSRYGIKANLGYDISETVSPYLTAGFARVNLKSTLASSNSLTENQEKNLTLNSLLLGGGIKFHLNEKWDINLEYNTQNLNFKNKTNQAQIKHKIQTTQLGFSFKF